MLSYDKQLFMIYKISPCPSLLKRGKEKVEINHSIRLRTTIEAGD
jgi:hypothetical protein